MNGVDSESYVCMRRGEVEVGCASCAGWCDVGGDDALNSTGDV